MRRSMAAATSFFLETVEQVLRYVRDRSFRVDVGVLIRTVQCVLARKGAR